MAKNVLVGVDLGGTSLLAVVTNAKGKILGEKKNKTHPEEGASAVLDRIASTIKEALADAKVRGKDLCAIGIGMPGPLNPKTGVIYHAPNLGPTWNNIPVAAYLSERFGCRTYLDNDVNVGAVGEHALGAGRGFKSMVAIFVGTGIGGGIILKNKLYRGTRYTAGEVGHTIILADGPRCGCGRHGCAESVASRTAIEREIRAGIAAGRKSVIPKIMEKMGRETMSSSVLDAARRFAAYRSESARHGHSPIARDSGFCRMTFLACLYGTTVSGGSSERSCFCLTNWSASLSCMTLPW